MSNEEHLDRVSDRIAGYVLEFVQRQGVGGTFHMEALTTYVQERDGSTAPDSPSRILRDLRRRGAVEYEVVSRHDSLYRIEAWDASKLAEEPEKTNAPTKAQLAEAVKTMREAWARGIPFPDGAIATMRWLARRAGLPPP